MPGWLGHVAEGKAATDGKAAALRRAVPDLTKTVFARLAEVRPDVLIVDFIDERFDLLAFGDFLVNDSGDLRDSGCLAPGDRQAARVIPRLSDEAWALWSEGLERFARFVERSLPGCRLVLHAGRWADRALGQVEQGDSCSILPDAVTSRAAQNALLDRMHRAFAARLPQAMVIAAEPDLCVSDPAHRWGPAPFHYVPAYYAAVIDHLLTALASPRHLVRQG